MSIQRIQCGPRMSQAVVHNGVAYVSGQVAQPSTGATTVGEQTAVILAQIDELLSQVGSDKSKLLSANVWLTDITTFDQMNRVWEQWIAPGTAPARATVEARLAAPHYLVEISVLAAVG